MSRTAEKEVPDAPVAYVTISKDEESGEILAITEPYLDSNTENAKKDDGFDVIANFKSCPTDTCTFFVEGTKGFVQDLNDFGVDLYRELVPTKRTDDEKKFLFALARSWIHIPYFPSLHRPGWLLRYVLRPFNFDWVDTFLGDLGAGITVALTLVPQV